MEAARGRRPVGPESGLEGELTPRPVRLRALLLLLYLVKDARHSARTCLLGLSPMTLEGLTLARSRGVRVRA